MVDFPPDTGRDEHYSMGELWTRTKDYLLKKKKNSVVGTKTLDSRMVNGKHHGGLNHLRASTAGRCLPARNLLGILTLLVLL